MKVLQVFKDYYPPTYGGIEQHLNDVVHSLEGFQFSVLTSSRSRKMLIDDDDGVRVIRAPEYFRPVSTPITPRWSKLLRRSGADLLHFHMPNPFGEITYLTSRSPAPMVATYHADIIGRRALLPFFRPIQNRFLDRSRRIVVSNPNLLKSAQPLKGREKQCLVIPFGVDPEYYSVRPPEAEQIRQDFGSPIVIFVGRIAYYKGLDVLVEAMRNVDATCLIVGSGPKEDELKQRIAATAGMDRRVVLVGDIDESLKRAYLHAADLYVLPSTSRAETFGISMLEAMACGVPAISTELGTGTSWVNRHRVTGLVIAPGDPNVLSGAIKTMLRDETKRQEMGAAAAYRVRERFTRKKMLDDFADLYHSI